MNEGCGLLRARVATSGVKSYSTVNREAALAAVRFTSHIIDVAWIASGFAYARRRNDDDSGFMHDVIAANG